MAGIIALLLEVNEISNIFAFGRQSFHHHQNFRQTARHAGQARVGFPLLAVSKKPGDHAPEGFAGFRSRRMQRLQAVIESPRPYVRTKGYFGPCRRRRGAEEYRGPERRDKKEAAEAAE